MSSSNVLNLAFRGTQVAAMAAEQLVRILAELSEKAEASRVRKEFLTLAKESPDDVRARYFNPSEYGSVKNAFEQSENFIPMATYQDANTNKVICFYMKKDEENVNKIFAKARAVDRSLYASSKMINEHIGQRLVVVKNLTETQKNNLANYLELQNLPHSVETINSLSINSPTRLFSITCLGDTQDKLDIIRKGLEKTARDDAGISGKYHSVDFHSPEAVCKMIDAAIKNEEGYIVSASNPKSYIHISKSGFSYISNGKEIESLSKSASQFAQSLYSRIQDMPIPLAYPDDGFMNKSGIDLTSEAAKRLNMIPVDKEEQTKLSLEEKARILVGLKMGLDNGGQYKLQSSFYNSEVSFSEFFAIEQINDAYEAEMGKPLNKETLEYYNGLVSDLDAAEKQKDYVKSYIGDIYNRCEDLTSDDRLTALVPEEKITDKSSSLDEYINDIDLLNDRFDDFDIETPDIE